MSAIEREGISPADQIDMLAKWFLEHAPTKIREGSAVENAIQVVE